MAYVLAPIHCCCDVRLIGYVPVPEDWQDREQITFPLVPSMRINAYQEHQDFGPAETLTFEVAFVTIPGAVVCGVPALKSKDYPLEALERIIGFQHVCYK